MEFPSFNRASDRKFFGKLLALFGGSCLSLIATVAVINMTLGAWCFAYLLDSFVGKHLPLLYNVIGGLFLGELTIPATVIVWLVRMAGVPTPFFHVG